MADATDVMSEPQAAAALRVSSKTLKRWRQAGRVSFDCTPGGRIRYTWQDLLALRRTMHVSANVPLCTHMSGEMGAAAE